MDNKTLENMTEEQYRQHLKILENKLGSKYKEGVFKNRRRFKDD